MRLKELNKELNKYGKYVIQQARSNLTTGRKNVNRSLYDSLEYKVLDKGLEFSMLEYGTFQDKGVSGKIKKYNTPFSYKSKQPPSKPLADWAKARNIRLRDSKGKFKKGNYNTIGFLIARSIYRKGIKPSLFFTKPFEKAYERRGEKLVQALINDIQNNLENGN